jgi:hypothetical protein
MLHSRNDSTIQSRSHHSSIIQNDFASVLTTKQFKKGANISIENAQITILGPVTWAHGFFEKKVLKHCNVRTTSAAKFPADGARGRLSHAIFKHHISRKAKLWQRFEARIGASPAWWR